MDLPVHEIFRTTSFPLYERVWKTPVRSEDLARFDCITHGAPVRTTGRGKEFYSKFYLKFQGKFSQFFSLLLLPCLQQQAEWRSNMSSAGDDVLNTGVIATEGAITVSSADELMSALANADGGETILLESGNYGDFGLWNVHHPFAKFASEVTIKSADPADPAVFSSVKITGVDNLTFDSLKFDYVANIGSPTFKKPFFVNKSSDIIFKNSIFDGDLARGVGETEDGFGTGFGIYITNSSDVKVDNNEFFNWYRAGVFGSVDNLSVKENEVHKIGSDGFNFADVDDVLIEANYIHDFEKSPENGSHMDMIQFWTSGTNDPSTNIVIRQNILDSGSGSQTQSIFMRNEMVDAYGAGQEMYYRNILIEDNVILNAHTHGITVGETLGLNIKNNTILHNQDSADRGLVNVPTIHVKDASQNVVIANNIVPRLDLDSTENRLVENNVVVQRDNAAGENYYGDLFVNGLADSNATLADLMAVPGGTIEQLNAGSSLTRFTSTPDNLSGVIHDQAGTGLSLLSHVFEISEFYGPNGKLDLAGAEVTWDFGDGTKGNGLSEAHSFARSGTYEVSASVNLADGRAVEVRKTIEVQTPVALHADFGETAEDQSNIPNPVTMRDGVTFEAGQDGNAVRLNDGLVSYGRGPEFINNSEFSVLFDFKKDYGDESASGRVIYFARSFVISVGTDGISAQLNTSAGSKWVSADKIGVHDSDWHRVALTFSGETGAAILYVDGVEVGRVTGLDGGIQIGSVSHDLHLGDPFGSWNFPGLLDNVTFLRGALSGEQVQAGFSVKDGALPAENIDPDEDESDPVPVDDAASNDAASDPVMGTEDNDRLYGEAGNDSLFGEGGDDRVFGEAGDDVLDGGQGADRLWGGDGNDRLQGGADGDRLMGGTGDDLIEGGQGNDGLSGDVGDDVLDGGDGSDSLFGGDGQDVLYGGAGIDKLYGDEGNDSLYGGEDRDRLFGGQGDDALHGGSGYDGLFGGAGNDVLFGGEGRDLLFGDQGNDVLVGGNGDDDLTGGEGADEFVFGLNTGRDRVFDFDVGNDMITLQGLDFTSVPDVIDSAFDVRGVLILHLDVGEAFSWSTSNYVGLVGIDKSDLHDGNVSLVA